MQLDALCNMMPLDALCSAVPPEMVSTIADKRMAKEAWDSVATMHDGDDRVKKNTAQRLRREFDLGTFKDGETVEDYALHLNGMVDTLATIGDVGACHHGLVRSCSRSAPSSTPRHSWWRT